MIIIAKIYKGKMLCTSTYICCLCYILNLMRKKVQNNLKISFFGHKWGEIYVIYNITNVNSLIKYWNFIHCNRKIRKKTETNQYLQLEYTLIQFSSSPQSNVYAFFSSSGILLESNGSTQNWSSVRLLPLLMHAQHFVAKAEKI